MKSTTYGLKPFGGAMRRYRYVRLYKRLRLQAANFTTGRQNSIIVIGRGIDTEDDRQADSRACCP